MVLVIHLINFFVFKVQIYNRLTSNLKFLFDCFSCSIDRLGTDKIKHQGNLNVISHLTIQKLGALEEMDFGGFSLSTPPTIGD